MSNKPIRAVAVSPGKAACTITFPRGIPNKLSSGKALTPCGVLADEGNFHVFCLDDSENGSLPFNRNLFGENYYGEIVICGMGEEGDVSLTKRKAAQLVNRLNAPEAMVELPEQEETITMGGM